MITHREEKIIKTERKQEDQQRNLTEQEKKEIRVNELSFCKRFHNKLKYFFLIYKSRLFCKS